MLKRQDGFLLVTVLFVMVVVTILALGTSFTSIIDRQVANRQRVGTEAFYLANAGMERLKTALFLTLSDQFGDGTDACGFPEFDVDLGGGLILLPGITSAPIPFTPITNGWYEVRFERSGAYYVLTSTGFLAATVDADQRSAQSTIQLVAAVGEGPSGVWDNAIFARILSSGSGALTGTIAAYGSVHIVNGDVELDSSESLTASGTSGIFNNYNGRGNQTNATAAATSALGSDRSLPFDLCSRLKVAQGNIRVQSNATGIGAEGDLYDVDDGTWVGPSGPQINSIEGVYLGTGDVVDQSGNPLTPTSQRTIYTRAGVAGYEGFDLPFPDLPDGFPGDNEVLDASNCSLIVEVGGRPTLRLPPVAAASVTCGVEGSSITWNEDSKELELDGDVAIPDADLLIARARTGNQRIDALKYRGIGQILVGTKSGSTRTGNVDINAQILPANPDTNYIDDGMAIVTAGDIEISGITGNMPPLSTLLYAEGLVDIRQQVAIVGAVVGRTVNVQQVPRVLYTPEIGNIAEELCLPGSVCATGEFGNRGPWSEVSTEVR